MIDPPFEGGALATLKDSNLLDIFSFLKPSEAIKWSQTNKTFASFFASKAADQIWERLLYSAEVDKFGEYKEKLPAHRRTQLEKHFSCRRVVSGLSSTVCSVCGTYAENFCVMTCTRVCQKCWSCPGVGREGIVVQQMSLCAVGYAKTHYLLSDKDIKCGLFCLKINDATKSHGLISPKMTIVLESEARKLAEKKFNNIKGGLAAEKTSRAKKAKEKWEERKEATLKGEDLPKEPDSVRKEREKDAPTWTNFVAANQASMTRSSAILSEYGLYTYVYTRTPSEMLTALASVFVTRDTPEQVMAKYPHVTHALLDAGRCKILTNLIDGVFVCVNGGTLLLDMECNLPTMAAEASESARTLSQDGNNVVGGQLQDHCICLFKDIKIEGTPRAHITSNRAIFWAFPGSIVALHSIRMSVTRSVGSFNYEYYAPALVLCSHCSVTSCHIESETCMYAILMHAPSATISDCNITTSRAGDTVHITHIKVRNVLLCCCLPAPVSLTSFSPPNHMKNVVFSGNRFTSNLSLSTLGEDGLKGFFFDLNSPLDGGPLAGQVLAFQRQLQKDNTFIESYYCDHHDYDRYDY